MAVILLLGLCVLNLGYGFEGSFRKLGDYGFVSETLGGPREDGRTGYSPEPRNRFEGTWLAHLPVPLPKNYVMGIDFQKWEFERKYWSYLRGEWKFGGWWYYYLYALAIKVPLGTWTLMFLALLVTLFGERYAASWRHELMLLAPLIVVLVLVSSQTGFSHHLRYVLPVFPFAFIWASKVARAMDLKRWKIASMAGVAVFWTIGSSLWFYPHSLSYFNELVGGPTGGHYHLSNSNIDWGQDLLYLKRWLDDHPEARPLGVAYDPHFIDPALVDIEYTSPPPGPDYREPDAPQDPKELGPKPGWYALSVDRIHSLSKRHLYFLHFEPVAMAGYSIYIYHITPDEANRVRRQLGMSELSDDWQPPEGGDDG